MAQRTYIITDLFKGWLNVKDDEALTYDEIRARLLRAGYPSTNVKETAYGTVVVTSPMGQWFTIGNKVG